MQVPDGACIWQKERLLNIALSYLPADVDRVCWLDCDVIFDSPEWVDDVVAGLDEFLLVQCFSDMIALPPRVASIGTTKDTVVSGRSIASLVKDASAVTNDFVPPTTRRFRRGLCGLAWAARRSLLEQFGFYDAMIAGSGDRALVCAGLGRFQDAISTARLGNVRADHYLRWARPFHDAVQGAISARQGRLFHLWHGDIENRRYLQRHEMLASLDFDPNRDLTRTDAGAWQWTPSASPELRAMLEAYFPARREDGPAALGLQAKGAAS